MVLREEAISLGLQSVDFTVLVKSCLVEVVSSTTRGLDTEAAFDILSALISVRRQGESSISAQLTKQVQAKWFYNVAKLCFLSCWIVRHHHQSLGCALSRL